MRKSLVLAPLFLLAIAAVSFAGVPAPEMSEHTLSAAGADCHYRFRANGALDVLVVDAVVKDAFGTPVADCPTTFSLTNPSIALCGCDGLDVTVNTNAQGEASASFSRIGGNGSVDVVAETNCAGGAITLFTDTIDFISADYNGSCEGDNAITIVDIGTFSGGLPPGYNVSSDFDCDGDVDIVDIGNFSGGLGVGCN